MYACKMKRQALQNGYIHMWRQLPIFIGPGMSISFPYKLCQVYKWLDGWQLSAGKADKSGNMGAP